MDSSTLGAVWRIIEGMRNHIWHIAAVLSVVVLGAQSWGAEPEAGGGWLKVDEGRSGERGGAVLLSATGGPRMLLVGPAEGAPAVQTWDPATGLWSTVVASAPGEKGHFYPYYQAAYDPGSRTVFCLSGGPVLYALPLAEKKWKSYPPALALEGLSWHTLACDPVKRRLVVVGADKRPDNLGWCRTVVFDIDTGKWSRLQVADEEVVREHRELVAVKEAIVDVAGRIRLAWYRDPRGVGTEAERSAIGGRCAEVRKMPQGERFATELTAVATLVQTGRTLDGVKASRALLRRIEEAAEAHYPVPCSRRNSPLAFDEKSGLFVLFGGDHEDYLLNDTWVLDLRNGSWRRAKPAKAPSPRAGHALCGLPRRGGVVLYEGYVQSSSADYGACPYAPLDPMQLWRYDPPADRWDLLALWRQPGLDDRRPPAPRGFFDGYASERFCPPALAAWGDDELVLAAHACGPWFWKWKRPSETWRFSLARIPHDEAGRDRFGMAPNQRLYRSGPFRAAFGEVSDEPKDTGFERLPENRWVRLPDPPRNPCQGCRQRDWGTSVWDADREQILLWGGGHCVRSASTVVHYSPASGRIVEGYDADEPYSANGGGGFDSSVLNRPWVSAHNYNHYAYDPQCRLLVSGRGYLYDPERMDWLRMEPLPLPYAFAWGSTVVESSRHGAIAWAKKKGADAFGLWRFDRQQGWIDLEPRGQLFGPYCDAHGMVYDAKRDRMILSGVGGGYQRLSNGTFLAFDFASRALDTLTPANATWAKTRNAREMVHVEHADWVLFGDQYRRGDEKTGKLYTRVYDCAQNKMLLLDAGDLADPRDPAWVTYSTGWMYDAKRRLVYVFTIRGEAWALQINPQTARLLQDERETGC